MVVVGSNWGREENENGVALRGLLKRRMLLALYSQDGCCSCVVAHVSFLIICLCGSIYNEP